MGTQAGHVDKLARVWPAYTKTWAESAGFRLEGADVWVVEGGWTPFPFFINYLLTGKAGVVTNHEAQMLDRYLARAVNGSLACAIPDVAESRREVVEGLRWIDTVSDAVTRIGGVLHERVQLGEIPLDQASIDLCHSGGTLEHVEPRVIAFLLAEAARVLRPGGVMSHVVDHRDHLHHADPSWPFLSHLSLGTNGYRILAGHRLMYHNRLLPTEVETMFTEAGFEPIATRRMILPDHVYVDSEQAAMAGVAGIERRKLAKPFRQASDADLRTAAAHYLYRRV